MKRYKRLWDDFISMENLELAAKKAVKSKKSKASVKKFLDNKSEYLIKLQNDLINNNFHTSGYRIKKIFEPKERIIYILPLYPDHILHHAIINILGPIWTRSFIRDSYACIPGKGLHKASKRLMQFIRRNKYVLQCDIRKFYPSINHQIMFNILKHKIADVRLLNVLRDIIWSCGGENNLPIGNLTSQWMGNVYLNEMDYFVKNVLMCRDYIRYCDDFCLFGNDKQELHRYEKLLEQFLKDNLGLRFSKSVVFPTARGVVFIGYRHFKKFVMLRKYGVKKITRRIMNIAQYKDCGALAVGQLAAFHGWVKWACGYNFVLHLVNAVRKIADDDMANFVQHRMFMANI